LPIETKKLDSHGGLCLKKIHIVQVELNRHERRVDKKKKLLRSKDILIIPNSAHQIQYIEKQYVDPPLPVPEQGLPPLLFVALPADFA